MSQSDQSFLVFSAMRNEGPFIVEWVSWYRMLGFDILIATNDCTDHSDALLDALADAGWLTHITHTPGPRQPPKFSAHKAGYDHPLVAAADWLLVCDVDEFLVLHDDDTIQGFMGEGPHDFLGMSFSWRCFGTGNHQTYEDGLVHRQFRWTGPPNLGVNRPSKAMFRNALQFERLGAHTPHGFSGNWDDISNRWVDCEKQTLAQFSIAENHPIRHLQEHQINHSKAQMNHYILRAAESYDLKRGIPSASAFNDRYTEGFFRRHNKNGFKDASALRFNRAFREQHDAAMALPGVARLHHLCCADYVERICTHQGRDHHTDPRWLHHMARADA